MKRQEHRERVTIFTTTAWPGNVFAIRGKLIAHGTVPTSDNPKTPYAIYQSERDNKRRTIQKKEMRPYLLIVRGSGPTVPHQQVDATRLPYAPDEKGWKREADEVIEAWITEHPDQVIADYRSIL